MPVYTLAIRIQFYKLELNIANFSVNFRLYDFSFCVLKAQCVENNNFHFFWISEMRNYNSYSLIWLNWYPQLVCPYGHNALTRTYRTFIQLSIVGRKESILKFLTGYRQTSKKDWREVLPKCHFHGCLFLLQDLHIPPPSLSLSIFIFFSILIWANKLTISTIRNYFYLEWESLSKY